MPANIEILYKKAVEAIDKLFENTNVTQSRTKEKLEELKDHLEMLIESLDA